MKGLINAAAIGAAAVGTACAVGALTLFERVIPRQDTVRVDLNEMANAEKWEEYKKIITPRKEWLLSQNTEHITIRSRDGLTLHADYLPAEKESNTVVFCGHGYTGCGNKDCAAISVFFHELGYNCLIMDHRAHGKSEGKYIGFGILDRYDWKEWVKYMDSRFDNAEQIIFYGVSMGASIALMTAGFTDLSPTVKAVIADCGYTSPYDVFAHILKKDYHLPPFPIMNINDQLCRHTAGYGFSDYSTVQAVQTTKLPILFIHGEDDDFVPLWMSKKNYSVCRSPKDILIVKNAAHAASYYENRPAYEAKVKSFLNKYIGG